MKLKYFFILFLIVSFYSVNFISFAQTSIPGGLVSGTWNLAGSPYLIQGAIQINNGSTLVIEPGVSVIFQGAYKLNVQGRLIAIGTETDSITFIPSDSTTGWKGIVFDHTPMSNDSSKIFYSKIHYVINGYNGGGALYFDEFSKAIISNCHISHCTGSGGGGAISCGLVSNIIIRNNKISNNSVLYCGGGISVGSCDPVITNNVITNNGAFGGGNPRGGGVYFSQSNAVFSNNTVANNSGVDGGGLYFYLSSPVLKNNIVYGNSATNSGPQVFLESDDSDPNFYYCDIEGGTAAFELNGNIYTGVYQNNINTDPMFVSPSVGSGNGFSGINANWSLQATSPCIDAGDPATNITGKDITGSPRTVVCRTDMGAYEYQSGPPFLLSISQTSAVHCYSDSTGVLTVYVSGGSTPYNYTWSNGETSSVNSGLAAGFYSVTVSEISGCTRTDTFNVIPPAEIVMATSTINIDCSGNCNGAASVIASGGTTPFTFIWNTGDTLSSTGNDLCIGDYSVTVSDAFGCTADTSATITSPGGLSFYTTAQNVSCYGENDGIITVVASGGTPPIQYSKNGGAYFWHANVFMNLTADSYNIVIMDNSGCKSDTQIVTITEPAIISILPYQTNLHCFGIVNGTATATANVSGGIPPYSYEWSTYPTQYLETATDLILGNYTVTVNDSQNCTMTEMFSIVQTLPEVPICLVTVDTVSWKNKVMWEKESTGGVTGYSIYKEVGTNIYSAIGFVPYSDPGVFIDVSSVPESYSNRYKITSVDTCGGESDRSFYHKTVNLTIASFGSTMGLNWNDYVDESGTFVPVNYFIYRGNSPTNMTLLDSVPGGTNSYNDNNVFSIYYYIIGVKKNGGCNTAKSDFVSFSNKKDNSTLVNIAGNELQSGTILISPNPMSTSATISIPNYKSEALNPKSEKTSSYFDIRISDFTGKVVRSEPIPTSLNPHGSSPDEPSQTQFTIERDNLKPGIYFIELNAGRIYRGKLIVE